MLLKRLLIMIVKGFSTFQRPILFHNRYEKAQSIPVHFSFTQSFSNSGAGPLGQLSPQVKCLLFGGGVIFCQRSKFWISSQFIKGCKNVCKRFYLVVVRIIHNHSPLSEISAPTQHIAHHARGNKGQQMAMKSAVGLHE